jgi:hypothetical protein
VPAASLADDRRIVWRLHEDADVRRGLTLTLRARTSQVGDQPANERAAANWVDYRGDRGAAVFPIPWIHVEPRATRDPSFAVDIFLPRAHTSAR